MFHLHCQPPGAWFPRDLPVPRSPNASVSHLVAEGSGWPALPEAALMVLPGTADPRASLTASRVRGMGQGPADWSSVCACVCARYVRVSLVEVLWFCLERRAHVCRRTCRAWGASRSEPGHPQPRPEMDSSCARRPPCQALVGQGCSEGKTASWLGDRTHQGVAEVLGEGSGGLRRLLPNEGEGLLHASPLPSTPVQPSGCTQWALGTALQDWAGLCGRRPVKQGTPDPALLVGRKPDAPGRGRMFQR